MKTCSKCGGAGPFGRSASCSDGLDSICRACRKQYSDRPENKKRAAKWRDANRERIREQKRVNKFGLTTENYNAILNRQKGKCAICLHPLEAFTSARRKKYLPHIDHCHATERVRGILCTRCNVLIGMSSDEIFNLLSAAQYLLTYRPEISERVKKIAAELRVQIKVAIDTECYAAAVRQDEDDRIGMLIGSGSEEDAIKFWTDNQEYEAVMNQRAIASRVFLRDRL